MRVPKFSTRQGISMLVILLLLAGASCKSKKAAMAVTDPAAEKAKMEQEATMRRQEEEARKQALEAEARAAEAKRKESEPYRKLDNYFSAIASSSSLASANSSISEALTLFASKDTPVLIVISEENGQKDYDRPTTIGEYLNYLKDQKKSINKISQLQFDSAGKITEVELATKK